MLFSRAADTTEEDGIYRFGLSPGVGTSVQRCSDIIEQSRVLDAPLVSVVNSLLQTNCILWVKGPSDRIYLKLWLRHHRAGHEPVLIEGGDFLCVTMAAKCSAGHFAFAETAQDE